MEGDPLTVVDRFNDACNRQDVDAVMALMTEDCVFENTVPPPVCGIGVQQEDEMEETARSQQALRDFDEGRHGFEGALRSVPDAALTYLKPGDDYALGGLVLHVNVVMEHYLDVLQAVVGSGEAEEVRVSDPAAAFEAAHGRARVGVEPGELDSALQTMNGLHAQVRSVANSVPEARWERSVAVRVGDGDPYAASPADVLGWLVGHYQEHIPQAQQLRAEWESGRASKG